MSNNGYRFLVLLFFAQLLFGQSQNHADDQSDKVIHAIERLKVAPQWAHLNTQIVSDAAGYHRTGPELNATIQVFDPDGKPLADALVVIGESESELVNLVYRMEAIHEKLRLPLALNVTDEQGLAEFPHVRRTEPGVRDRDRTVATAHALVVTSEYAWFVALLQHTSSEQRLSVTLKHSTTMTGQVIGPDHKPVAEAVVTWMSWSKSRIGLLEEGEVAIWNSPFVPSCRSDASGKYSLSGIPAEGFLDIRVSHPTFQTQRKLDDFQARWTDVSEKQHDIDLIEIQKNTALSFQMVDAETGAPISGGNASAWRWKGRFDETGMLTTDRYQRSSFSGNPALDRIRMQVAPDKDYVPVLYLEAPHDSKTTAKIPLVRGIDIAGRVQDAFTGAAIENVLICGFAVAENAKQTMSSSVMLESRTDSDGIFHLRVPKKGKWRIQVASCVYGYESCTAPTEPNTLVSISRLPKEYGVEQIIDTLNGPSPEVLFKLRPISQIRGKCIDEKGNPLKDVSIVCSIGNQSPEWTSEGKSGPDGKFLVMPPPGVSGEVTVKAKLGTRSKSTKVTLNGYGSFVGAPLLFQGLESLPERIVTGSIYVDDMPQEGVTIGMYRNDANKLNPVGAFNSGISDLVGTGTTDKDGYYEIEIDDPDLQMVLPRVIAPSELASHHGILRTYKLDDLKTELPSIEFRTRHGDLSVQGEVITPDGDPVEGAMLHASSDNYQVQLLRKSNAVWPDPNVDSFGTTDSQGKFRCNNFGAGTATMSVRMGDMSDYWSNFAIPRLRVQGGSDDVILIFNPTLSKPPRFLQPTKVAANDPPTNHVGFSIQGKIVDAKGPVPNYKIEIGQAYSGKAVSTATNEKGEFRVEKVNLPSAHIRDFYVGGDSKARDERGWLTTTLINRPVDDFCVELPDLRLINSGSLRVNLVNANNQPVQRDLTLHCHTRQNQNSPIELQIKNKATELFVGLPNEEPLVFSVSLQRNLQIRAIEPVVQRMNEELVGFPFGFALRLDEVPEITLTIW